MCRILLTHVAYSYFCASRQQLSSRLVRPLTQIQPSIDFSCNPVSHNCIPFYRLEASCSFHSIASRIVSLCSLRKWSFSRMLFQEETIYFLKEKLWFGFSLITSIFISLKENRGISLKISNAKIKVKAYLIKLYSYRKVKIVCFNKFSSYVFSNAIQGKKGTETFEISFE